MTDIIEKKEINEVYEMCKKYLQENGYRYLKNDKLLLRLKIESIEMILESEQLYVRSENWLFNRLYEWYRNEKRKIISEEEKTELSKEYIMLISTYVNIEKVKMNEREREIINELKDIKLENNILNYFTENNKKQNYINVFGDEDFKDDKVEEMILKYYKEEELMKMDENNKDVLLRKNNINETIMKMLKMNDVKMNEIGLLMMIDLKVEKSKININEEINNRILRKMINEYGENERNRTVK